MASSPTPPEPLSVDQAKAHLRVTGTAEDDLISALIVAARAYVEDYTGLVLTARTVTETARELGRWIDLSAWPVVAVTSLSYADALGVDQPVDVATLAISYARRPVRIRPTGFGWGVASVYGFGLGGVCGIVRPGPVTIRMTAGFATPDDVPQTVKQAMLLLIQSWFDNRSAVEAGLRAAAIEVPFTVDVLLRRWRLQSI